MKRVIVLILVVILSLSLASAADFTEYSALFRIRPLPPSSASVGILYNTQHLLTVVERTTTDGPFSSIGIKHPLSIFVMQNILTQSQLGTLKHLGFGIEVHLNSNNAPAAAAEISTIFQWDEFGVSIGFGGVSSLETNAWTVRSGLSYSFGALMVQLATEAALFLGVPDNQLQNSFGAVAAWHHNWFELAAEGRFTTPTRWEAGMSAAVRVGIVSARFGIVYATIGTDRVCKTVGTLRLML